MVAQKLMSIPLHTRTKLWHNSSLWLFKYVVFESI